jgi:hypothetical protein
MQEFDAEYGRRVIERLREIAPDAQPEWGSMSRDALFEHLVWALRHSMGRSHQVPYSGNWVSSHLIGPLVVGGWLPIPKNLRFPKHLRQQGITGRESGDLETLEGLMEEYLNLIQADELQPAPHPFFGAIGVDGWARMHVRHFEHHCRQFGV